MSHIQDSPTPKGPHFRVEPPHAPALSPSPLYETLKPVAEGVAAGAILASLAVPFFARSLLMHGDPTIFVQPRIGQDGKELAVVKLRTFTEVKSNPDLFAPSADLVPVRFGLAMRKAHVDEALQALHVVGAARSFLHVRAVCRVLLGYGVRFKAGEGPVTTSTKPPLSERLLRFVKSGHLGMMLSWQKPDMSLIGPRPIVEGKAKALGAIDPDALAKRLSIRQGITGIAQIDVKNPNTTDGLRRELALDSWYADNRSPSLDLALAGLTVVYCVLGSRVPMGLMLARYWPWQRRPWNDSALLSEEPVRSPPDEEKIVTRPVVSDSLDWEHDSDDLRGLKLPELR